MYRVSEYNLIQSSASGESHLVNTRTTAVLGVSGQPLSDLARTLTTSKEIHDGDLDARVLRVLLSNGFVLPCGFDEKEWVRRIHMSAREGRNALALGIVLTLACNFRCAYCYETHDDVHVTDELSDAILAYTASSLEGKSRLRIAWFGGEPLLRTGTIRRLTRRMTALCDERDVSYSARISTNGFLLNHDVALLLKEARVSDVQVTLDGPPGTHDRRRFLVGGGPTFRTIHENLKSAADLFERVVVRINIDNRNAASIPELLEEYLHPMRDRIQISFSVAVSPGCVESVGHWTTPPPEFWEIEKGLGALADRLGFKVMRGYPIPCTSFCMAYQKNSFLIDPYAEVNRCPKFLGKHGDRYGKLRGDGSISINSGGTQEGWDSWTPFSDPDCSGCRVLPLCMGGCLLYLPSGKNKASTHRCFAKHDLVDSVLRESDFMELVGGAQHTLIPNPPSTFALFRETWRLVIFPIHQLTSDASRPTSRGASRTDRYVAATRATPQMMPDGEAGERLTTLSGRVYAARA